MLSYRIQSLFAAVAFLVLLVDPTTSALSIPMSMSSVPSSSSSSSLTTPRIENFRSVPGLAGVYRCASTDGLAGVTKTDTGTGSTDALGLASTDEIVWKKTGLVVDLRSPSERSDQDAKIWMEQAGFVAMIEDDDASLSSLSPSAQDKAQKTVFRVDVLSPPRFMQHLTDNWLTPSQKAASLLWSAVDANKLHALRMNVFNERGLEGLNEGILETGGTLLCRCLQRMTQYMEQRDGDHGTGDNGSANAIVIHCVHGKDR